MGSGYAGQLAFSENAFGQDDMDKRVPGCRLRVENFALHSGIDSPGVSAAGGVLLHGAAIRLETDDAIVDSAEAFGAVA